MIKFSVGSRVMAWETTSVRYFLAYFIFFAHLSIDTFKEHKVDGPLLLRIDQSFLRDVLNLHHPLVERRLLRYLDELKELQLAREKVSQLSFRLGTHHCLPRTRPSMNWTNM